MDLYNSHCVEEKSLQPQSKTERQLFDISRSVVE